MPYPVSIFRRQKYRPRPSVPARCCALRLTEISGPRPRARACVVSGVDYNTAAGIVRNQLVQYENADFAVPISTCQPGFVVRYGWIYSGCCWEFVEQVGSTYRIKLCAPASLVLTPLGV